jgi:hypothetical protein
LMDKMGHKLIEKETLIWIHTSVHVNLGPM